MRDTLRDQIDNSLRNQVEMMRACGQCRDPGPRVRPGDRLLLTNTPVFTAFVRAARGRLPLPPPLDGDDGAESGRAAASASRSSPTATIEGTRVRVHVGTGPTATSRSSSRGR